MDPSARVDPHVALSHGWFLSQPSVMGGIKAVLSLSAVFLFVQVVRWWRQAAPPNPFRQDERKPRQPYVIDQKKRDAVLKQGFSMDKVPSDLDAIVVGSGIGGLTTAAIMAKSGRRVLVLEQHDQAGGCCHTFLDKGYEWDVGIHYIGDMGGQTLNKTLCDQITDGQLEWAELDENYDDVCIGYGDDRRKYKVVKGKEAWMAELKRDFPNEHAAIDRYFELIYTAKRSHIEMLLKMLPLWLSWLVVRSGLLKLLAKGFRAPNDETTLDVLRRLTDNKDLQTVFCYSWGDYNTQPNFSSFHTQASLSRHFMRGGFFPVGGASEIAMSMIPVIERAGGRVLVRADVQEILHNGHKAMGVLVKKGTSTYRVEAPVIISNAGLYNTFQRLLPLSVAKQSYYSRIAADLKPGGTCFTVFIGMNASNEELGLRRHNVWAFTTNDQGTCFDDYSSKNPEEVMDAEAPIMFLSFPSTKDPNWANHPGRAGRSTATAITLANWDWFKQHENTTLKKRGDEYEELKKTIGHQVVEQVCKLYPQLRDHIDYVDIGSPVTNKYYLAQPHGELYGLDHSPERFDPWTVAQLRPQTDVPGLFLTGQDILMCGFTGALYGGLLAAGSVLGRNTIKDVVMLHSQIKKEAKEKKKGQ